MNNFSCSLSCTWMPIIDCLSYVSGSLSRDVSWEYICVVIIGRESLMLYFNCAVADCPLCLFLMVPCVGLQSVIVSFPAC